jgi:hypothetical protein
VGESSGEGAYTMATNESTFGVPEPYCSTIANVTANDRAFFAHAPRAPYRVRPYVHGEFWPLFPKPGVNAFVQVRRQADGALCRHLLYKDHLHLIPLPPDLLMIQASPDADTISASSGQP